MVTDLGWGEWKNEQELGQPWRLGFTAKGSGLLRYVHSY